MKHSMTLSNLSCPPIDDQIYNWFVSYFHGHSHTTRFMGSRSGSAEINASVFQGSVIGPPMYIVAGLNLKPPFPDNYFDKYADDSYLIVPACSSSTAAAELANIETWAQRNNLNLNVSKVC